MIRLEHLHKYYNRGKDNQIHVINDVDLSLEETGLICLLGPSGCGKTTLLNVIGGLDKVDSGRIYFDSKLLQGSLHDEVRINDIDFVFQNYVLLPDKTVYDNLKLVLDMFEISKEDADERINYALKAVGMDKYSRRKAIQLSGGQMQRIAIARALVKSPKMIIADEPTGNLDEKNTTQIMNIIKKLSTECLVVLVTHERRLADFYADRIIEILDGKIIKDYQNSSSNVLLEKDDTNIYLQDMKNKDYFENDLNIKYFYTREKPNLKLNIIFKNDTFYVQMHSEDPKHKFKLLDSQSDTLVVDGHKPTINIDEIQDFDYSLPKLEKHQSKTSVIKFKDTMKMALTYIKSLKAKQKIFLLTFVLSAILVVVSISTLSRSLIYDKTDYMFEDISVCTVTNEQGITIDELKSLSQKYEFDNVLPSSLLLNYFNFPLYEQSTTSYSNYQFINHGLSEIDRISEEDLEFGRMPENDFEVVIDMWLVDALLKTNPLNVSLFIQGGGCCAEQLLNQEIYSSFDSPRYKIVGISKTFNPTIYLSLNGIYNCYVNKQIDRIYSDIKMSYEKMFITCGIIENNQDIVCYDLDGNELDSMPILKDNEILLNQGSQDYQNLNISNNEIRLFTNVKYKVVGSFIDDNYKTLISKTQLQDIAYDKISNDGKFNIYTNDKEELLKKMKVDGFNITDPILESLKDYKKSKLTSSISLLVFTTIILVASLVFLFFSMRASLISRIYEVGVYRALGIKKFDVIKIFISEILLISLFTSTTGFVLASIVVSNLQTTILSYVLYYPWYSALGAYIIIIVFNFIVGLIPISVLLKKTPAEILSKYDI